jgi:hypothetical protein
MAGKEGTGDPPRLFGSFNQLFSPQPNLLARSLCYSRSIGRPRLSFVFGGVSSRCRVGNGWYMHVEKEHAGEVSSGKKKKKKLMKWAN